MSPFLAHPAFVDMFEDMEKTAAGRSRSGRRPISADTLLSNEKRASAADDEYDRLAKGHGRIGGVLGAISGLAHGARSGSAVNAIVEGLVGGAAGYGANRIRHWAAGHVAPAREKKSSVVLSKIASVGKRDLAAAAAGALAFESLRRANEDRKLGRQIRKQQMG